MFQTYYEPANKYRKNEYYIFDEQTGKYLWPGKTIHNSCLYRWYKTKKEADKVIQEYEMNEKIAQIEEEIKLLAEEEIKLLEKERDRLLTPRHGDIVMAWDRIDEGKRLVVWNIKDHDFMAVGASSDPKMIRYCTSGGKEVERLYKEGAYKVIGNIFEGDSWDE